MRHCLPRMRSRETLFFCFGTITIAITTTIFFFFVLLLWHVSPFVSRTSYGQCYPKKTHLTFQFFFRPQGCFCVTVSISRESSASPLPFAAMRSFTYNEQDICTPIFCFSACSGMRLCAYPTPFFLFLTLSLSSPPFRILDFTFIISWCRTLCIYIYR